MRDQRFYRPHRQDPPRQLDPAGRSQRYGGIARTQRLHAADRRVRFIKPYKRIAESLRAVRRLVRLTPEVRMILVGEPHPEFPVHDFIRSSTWTTTSTCWDSLPSSNSRVICRPATSFSICAIRQSARLRAVCCAPWGWARRCWSPMSARSTSFPTASASKCRSVLDEEDLIFEYLNLLVSRPELARTYGRECQKAWVEPECNWGVVAERYVKFLGECVTGVVAPEPTAPLPDGRGSKRPGHTGHRRARTADRRGPAP